MIGIKALYPLIMSSLACSGRDKLKVTPKVSLMTQNSQNVSSLRQVFKKDSKLTQRDRQTGWL